MALIDESKEATLRYQLLVNTFLSPHLHSNNIPTSELLQALQADAKSEAGAIFLVGDNPDQMELVDGVGYSDAYYSTKYRFDQFEAYLTSHVGRKRCSLNESCRQLQALKDKKKLPFSNRCETFLKSKELRNLIAVPIMCHRDRCVGVLKLENCYRRSDRQPFPDEVFNLARQVASMIGLGYRQRWYGAFWKEWHQQKGGGGKDLNGIARFLASQVGAECASIFIKETLKNGRPGLKYAGGVGYKEPYTEQEYALTHPPTSFTAYVATLERPTRKTEAQLIEEKKKGQIDPLQRSLRWQHQQRFVPRHSCCSNTF